MKPIGFGKASIYIASVCLMLVFIALPQNCVADHHTRADLIGVLLYRIASHIHWANSSSISNYQIHIIDDDAAIADQVESIAKIRKLHDKNFTVSRGSDTRIPESVQLIYLSGSKADYFQEIRSSILNKNILLVTQNVQDDQNIFLNLYDTGSGEIKFRINKANVINQNLGVDPDIIFLGGNEVDVATLYRQGQEKLNRAKLQLAAIEQDIKKITSDRMLLSAKLKDRQQELLQQSEKLVGARDQVNNLTEQTRLYQIQLEDLTRNLKESQAKLQQQEEKLLQQSSVIEQHKRSIEKQRELQAKFEAELQIQRQLIQNQKIYLDERKRRLDQQKSEIELRSSILNKQKTQIDSQLERINDQKDTIIQQEKQIQTQSEEMSHRGKIIADQQTYLFFLSLLIAMVLLIMGLIYRNSRQNKLINQQLTEQRDLLSRSAIELAKARDIADKANQAKSSFLANMSHELRTPLNAVLGFSEFLASDKELNEKQLRYINIVNRSGQHLLSMINDVLDISKIEAGMVSVDLESVDIRELCGDVVSILSVKADSNNLRLILNIDETVPEYIVSDSVKLRQILINLLGNAIKFSSDGVIRLAVKVTENKEKLLLKVKDQGIGISLENQALIFKPFSQVGESSANRKGTGLGLSISRQYALLLGGDLNVESSLGKGSVFTCALPLRIASEKSAKILPFNRHIIGIEESCVKRSLLVVDDHSESRLLLNKILSKIGFHVEEAENGQVAVEKFGQHKVDLIFMDINMPVMDGVTACRKIRSLPDGDEVKIIAVTANASTEQLQSIQAEKFDNIVFKPFRINQLFDMVGTQLNAKFKYEHERRTSMLRRSPVDSDSISRYRAEFIKSLLESARQLDSELFIKYLDEVRGSDSYQGLLYLAQDFRFDYIIKVLEEAKNLSERNGIA